MVVGTAVIAVMVMIVADRSADENAADDAGSNACGSLVFGLLRLGPGWPGRWYRRSGHNAGPRAQTLGLTGHFGTGSRFLRRLAARQNGRYGEKRLIAMAARMRILFSGNLKCCFCAAEYSQGYVSAASLTSWLTR